MRKNKILSFSGKQMDLQSITLSKISQTHINTAHSLYYKESKRDDKKEERSLLAKRKGIRGRARAGKGG